MTRSIKEQRLKIDIERINESLDRLVLGYVIGKSKGDYFYQIPLLKQKLLEDDLEILIEGEMDGLISLRE